MLHAEELLGRTLRERWSLEQKLAVGGTSVVYAARHRNGKRVAIKVLSERLAVDARARTRFLREAYVANKVGHPGAVGVLDDGVEEDLPFLVMELIDGETLEQKWISAGRRLPVDDAVAVITSLLDILAAAHRAGIVHRDVKPSNVLIDVEGNVRLLDFGLARLDGPESTTVTTTGTMMGTPAFMAPEQARGLWARIDARTDLWAASAVAFTLLTGRHVHPGSTPNEVMIAAGTQPAPKLRAFAPDVPVAIAQVFERGLSFRMEDRFDDASQMLDALRVARISGAASLAITTTPTVPEEPAGVPTPARSRSRTLVVVGALVVAAVAALASWRRAPADALIAAEPAATSPAASSIPSPVVSPTPSPVVSSAQPPSIASAMVTKTKAPAPTSVPSPPSASLSVVAETAVVSAAPSVVASAPSDPLERRK